MHIVNRQDIPPDWDWKPLRDFVHHYKGGAPLHPSDFVSDGFPVLPKKAIVAGGLLNLPESEMTYCSQSYTEEHLNSVVDSSYLITTLRDLVPTGPSIGYIVQFNNNMQYIMAQGVYGIKLNEHLSPDYLIQLSNTEMYRRTMQRIMVGSTQVHIRTGEFLDIELPLPPLSEQRKIADILSTWDEAIATVEALIAALKERKRGLMQRLLTGEVRFSGFVKSDEVIETRFGDIPRDWKILEFGEITNIANGQVDPNVEPYFSMIHVGPENIQQDTGRMSGMRTAGEIGLTSGKYKFDHQAVLYGKINPHLNKVGLPDFEGVCSADMYPIWCKEEHLNRLYLFQFMLSDNFVKQSVAVSKRTGMPKINRQDLNKLEIIVPPVAEQMEISECFRVIDEEVDILHLYLEQIQNQKKGLMQRLLTGEVRVRVEE